ncbi:MAG: xylulokinase [Oscillospiraceae bacterium]|jgi:xylulokinase|nr:xylulokinase [Oscillospiraceae bacterium]
MSNACVLGLDLGTSGVKTALFSADGEQLCSASREYPLYQPRNGWAEQEPSDWWNASVETIGEVVRESGIDPSRIKALGMSGQMHGLVMLDEKGETLGRSIIWADQRTGAECEQITSLVGAKRLIEITANPALTGFTASKIMWVKNHRPELFARCRHILLPKDYIRYKLTGSFATEVSDASGMQLLDVPNRRWSEEITGKLGIPIEWLGKVYESPEVTGHISDQAARLTGLPQSTLVVGGAGDNAAAAVGTGVVRDGRAFCTIGTSGVVFSHTDKLSIDPLGRVHTFCCASPGAWHVMGVVQSAGLSLRWLRDTVCECESKLARERGVDPYDVMIDEARRSPIGANRLIYLPYLMGERTPHLDPDCRGAFIGLSAMHARGDLIRAVMEGVTYALNDSVNILRGMGVTLDNVLAVGGGARSGFWRAMLADVFGCPIGVPERTEGAALGAAILAAVGAGLYPNVSDACDRIIKVKSTQQPDRENGEAYGKVYRLYTRLYPSLRDSFIGLKGL